MGPRAHGSPNRALGTEELVPAGHGHRASGTSAVAVRSDRGVYRRLGTFGPAGAAPPGRRSGHDARTDGTGAGDGRGDPPPAAALAGRPRDRPRCRAHDVPCRALGGHHRARRCDRHRTRCRPRARRGRRPRRPRDLVRLAGHAHRRSGNTSGRCARPDAARRSPSRGGRGRAGGSVARSSRSRRRRRSCWTRPNSRPGSRRCGSCSGWSPSIRERVARSSASSRTRSPTARPSGCRWRGLRPSI